MEKKYEITEKTILWNGRILHQIKLLKDVGNVKTGRLGGWIEKESNLSQDGDCWVFNDAKVYAGAKVYGNAIIFGHAQVLGDSKIYDNAKVYENAIVFGNAEVYGNAWVCGNAEVYDNAKVYENANVYGETEICGDAKVYEHANVYGETDICGNAEIKSINDYAVFKNFWSSGRYFTWTRSNDMWRVGCFYGTGEELIKKAYLDSEKSGRKYKTTVKYVKRINTVKRPLLKKIIELFKEKSNNGQEI